MPVFQEEAGANRDSRIYPCRALPLPRLAPKPVENDESLERYEVVIIGSGPAGLMLTLLLARYGLGSSIACFESKPGTLKAGQADGLQPRTLEVFQSLGLVHELVEDGCHMSEVAFWNPKSGGGIERTSFVPDIVVPARYDFEATIHQGRIERVLGENLELYGPGAIRRSSEFVDFIMDASSDAEYPLRIQIDTPSSDGSNVRKVVRAKHLVGADGAHSRVRRGMGLELRGDTTDHIWGVLDFVADTNFPDIRKRSAIHSDAGSIMIIPRERISSGDYLTRLYVQVKDEVPARYLANGDTNDDNIAKAKLKERRAAITMESILAQAKQVFAPYTISIKEGTVVDWWAAYQIGQRLTDKFTLRDEYGLERVFIVGDACHTHSPKAGQGMNISMMDSYNLAWKLSHSLNGLSPSPSTARRESVLSTFEHERLTVARQLIEFDSKFSSMFSGKIDSAESLEGLTHEEFLKAFSDGSGFTSGCGVEYPPSIITDRDTAGAKSCVEGDDYFGGVIRPGRRLLDSVVRRYADANIRHLQDDFPSTGRYRILIFTTRQLKTPESVCTRALETICRDLIPLYPRGMIELVALHPFVERSFEWDDVPACLKEFAEMRLHGPSATGSLYSTYGVSEDKGAVVVVRPDGYVATCRALDEVETLIPFFDECLVRVSPEKPHAGLGLRSRDHE